MSYRIVATILIALVSLPAMSATIHVPSDQPTIQAGIDAAADGDTVELAEGTYIGEGNRDLDFLGKALVLRSGGSDPVNCVIDCEGSEGDSHRGFHFHAGESYDSVLEGISIINGWVAFDPYKGGGAVYCDKGSSPTIQNCVFSANHGSALYCRDWSGPRLVDCRFEDNMGRNGGGAYCVEGDYTIIRCQFIGNRAELAGGGLHGHAADFEFQDCLFAGNVSGCGAAIDMIYGCTAHFERCLFDGNTALESFWSTVINLHGMVTGNFVDCTFASNSTDTGGFVIITTKSSHGTLSGCTFWGNSVQNGTVVYFGELDGRVENTIIAASTSGRALHIDHVLSLSCCDLFGNAGGDWVDGLEIYLGINGNISEDPLFCDAENGDFSLHCLSPCLPGNHPDGYDCGLIGAWGMGCGITQVEESTWSSVKSLY